MTENNGNKPVYPIANNDGKIQGGITLREYFAIEFAKKGFDISRTPKELAEFAVECADELLNELENR